MRTTKPLLPLITFVLGALAAPPAQADAGWNLLVNGKAVHVDASKDWNENNFGLGIEREFDSGSRWVKVAMANGYRDSEEEMAYMAGGGIKRRFELDSVAPDWHVDVGLIAFLMTRHDVDNNRPFPGALPVLSLGNGRMAVNMTYLPASAVERAVALRVNDPTVDGVFFFQFSFRLRQPQSGRMPLALAAAGPDR